MDLNRVTLIGNLVHAPKWKTLASGQSVTVFTLATSVGWEDASHAKKEAVEFHDVQAFGKLADIIRAYVKAGSKVYVEGRLRSHSSGGKDGKTRQQVEVVAENLIMLGHRGRREVALKPEA